MSCFQVEKDGVVPHSWLMPLYRQRWLTMLRVEQGVDRGPRESSSIDPDSLRCGRVLNHDMDYCWRWNGYNFGLDLLITYSSQVGRKSFLLFSCAASKVKSIMHFVLFFSTSKFGYFANKNQCMTTSRDLIFTFNLKHLKVL